MYLPIIDQKDAVTVRRYLKYCMNIIKYIERFSKTISLSQNMKDLPHYTIKCQYYIVITINYKYR